MFVCWFLILFVWGFFFFFFGRGSTLACPFSASKRWCRDLYNACVQVQNFDWAKHLKRARSSKSPMEKHLNSLSNSEDFNGVLIWPYIVLTINIIHTTPKWTENGNCSVNRSCVKGINTLPHELQKINTSHKNLVKLWQLRQCDGQDNIPLDRTPGQRSVYSIKQDQYKTKWDEFIPLRVEKAPLILIYI